LLKEEKPKTAKPCAKCGGYYPGDCKCPNAYPGPCDCDGCQVLRLQDDPENHVCEFNTTAGDTEYDNVGEEYLVMECNCGETELVPTGANYYDELDSEEECVEPTIGYEDDLGCV